LDRLSPHRVEEILHAARGVTALVVGDVMLDKYITGTVDRISPEAPVPVLRVEAESSAIGGAGNVAANVVALGAGASVVGCVGSDENGRILHGALEAAGVSTEGVIDSEDRPTTVKTRVLARHQQVVRVDREEAGDVTASVAESLAQRISELAPGCHVVILEDYNKGVLVPSVIDHSVAVAAEVGVPTVVDPKRSRFWSYGGVSVFKPNAKELLLTLGEEGMALKDVHALLRLEAVARDVYDVSGAGDTVTAVVAVVLAAGGSLEEAAILANHAAAIEVSKAGVSTVGADEILHQYNRYRDR
jgi:D-beta-D-heptose 7-phosphate kinase/D-beta-D-heptose 1-phosphate adenosyltransferase